MCETWYESQRICYGTLTKPNSGQAPKEITETQNCIQEKFNLLKTHIRCNTSDSVNLQASSQQLEESVHRLPKHTTSHEVLPVQIVWFFVYLGFYVAFNTVQVISRRVVGRAEETSTYSSLGFCTVNCRPTASNYQLSHLRP